MTTDLEKQFFDTFGIEPMPYCCYHDCNCPIEDIGKFNSKCPKQAVTKECDARIMKKPQITDRILLELICILSSNPIHILFESMLSGIKEVELLKNSILLTCIANKDTIKHQVQVLFKEQQND